MADMSAVLGAKARKKLLASTVESASAPTSDFARRQMEKMGWTECVRPPRAARALPPFPRLYARRSACGG